MLPDSNFISFIRDTNGLLGSAPNQKNMTNNIRKVFIVRIRQKIKNPKNKVKIFSSLKKQIDLLGDDGKVYKDKEIKDLSKKEATLLFFFFLKNDNTDKCDEIIEKIKNFNYHVKDYENEEFNRHEKNKNQEKDILLNKEIEKNKRLSTVISNLKKNNNNLELKIKDNKNNIQRLKNELIKKDDNLSNMAYVINRKDELLKGNKIYIDKIKKNLKDYDDLKIKYNDLNFLVNEKENEIRTLKAENNSVVNKNEYYLVIGVPYSFDIKDIKYSNVDFITNISNYLSNGIDNLFIYHDPETFYDNLPREIKDYEKIFIIKSEVPMGDLIRFENMKELKFQTINDIYELDSLLGD